MRKILAPAALLTCVGAAPLERPPDWGLSENRRSDVLRGPPSDVACRDRIETVRAERGLPMLDRQPASTEDPLLIAAVDRRIDGCSVLVMRHDTSDVRPVPKPDGRTTLRPLR